VIPSRRKARLLFLSIVGIHLAASLWSCLAQVNIGLMHPDEQTGIVWPLSRITMHATMLPLMWIPYVLNWMHRIPLEALVAAFLLNSLAAVALIWFGTALVGALGDRLIRRHPQEPE
jgi:hypothetical protein